MVMYLLNCEDGDEPAWIQPDGRPLRPAKFEGDLFDFRQCCAPECPNRADAVYRLRGFVRSTAKPPAPSDVASRGHFVAYFQDAGTW